MLMIFKRSRGIKNKLIRFVIIINSKFYSETLDILSEECLEKCMRIIDKINES